MGLTKLGKYISPLEARNTNNLYGGEYVVGLSTQKQIIKTKADLEGVNLSSYKLFPPKTFTYVPDTSRRGDKVSLAYNMDECTYLVSSISIVFQVSNKERLLPEYLFMYFNRTEFDGYARFHSWGSARETFDWDEMCNIDIELPDITVQQKYVDIYKAMVQNQQCYERGLEDLKLVCNAYIERLTMNIESIGQHLILSEERNEGKLPLKAVRGISTSKEFISTKADMDGVSLNSYKVVPPHHIAYVADTSRRGDKISLAHDNTDESYLVSSISTVFTTDPNKLLSAYLMLFFSRPEFDRYARFHSWGSARETFDWSEMCDVKIPIPDIKIQQSIVNIYNAYLMRKEINEKLKAQIKDICPILIRGSLKEE